MILIKPSFEILTEVDPNVHYTIEKIGRTAYKSEHKITEISHEKFIRGIIKNGHESVLEHCNISIKFIIDRGVSHELVRHRLAAYTQESTRYCDYIGNITFIIPPWIEVQPGEYKDPCHAPSKNYEATLWFFTMLETERIYSKLRKNGWSPQMARSVLPNSLKTEIVMTANLREWRHVLKLRTASSAHPQMREIMIPLLKELKFKLPIIFEDIEEV